MSKVLSKDIYKKAYALMCSARAMSDLYEDNKEVTSKYSTYANTIKFASDSIEKKEIECSFPSMTWQDSKENIKILTEWKSGI